MKMDMQRVLEHLAITRVLGKILLAVATLAVWVLARNLLGYA